MKLLLTSAGITNASIKTALIELLGKPIADSTTLCIPTASYGMARGGANSAWRFIAGQVPRCPMTELGWKSVGVLELSSLDAGPWVPAVREADVLLGQRRALGCGHDRAGIRDRRPDGDQVTDDGVEVVSEGRWRLFEH